MKRDEQLDLATVTLELDLIVNAVCVDPSDQSIWIYYKWIIGHAAKGTLTRLLKKIHRLIYKYGQENPNFILSDSFDHFQTIR